jgi:tetrahydromethanopterin S-methyltransferase subunit G
MPSDVTREEFNHLEVRVDVLEREVEGEKMVTRHVLEQTRRNSDDLAAIKTRLDRVERKVDGLDEKFDRLDQKVDGWTRRLPIMIGEVMREVLRERDKS